MTAPAFPAAILDAHTAVVAETEMVLAALAEVGLLYITKTYIGDRLDGVEPRREIDRVLLSISEQRCEYHASSLLVQGPVLSCHFKPALAGGGN